MKVYIVVESLNDKEVTDIVSVFSNEVAARRKARALSENPRFVFPENHALMTIAEFEESITKSAYHYSVIEREVDEDIKPNVDIRPDVVENAHLDYLDALRRAKNIYLSNIVGPELLRLGFRELSEDDSKIIYEFWSENVRREIENESDRLE
jgi:hypothetical protein